MDDVTTITMTKACTKRLLDKLQENIRWAQMEIKPGKSRSISIIKGRLTNDRFCIAGEPIPTVMEKPFKSLRHWYTADLKDSKHVEQLRQETVSGLKRINGTALPGKLKQWCFQFGFLPWLMWPIYIYKLILSHAKHLERLVSTQLRKWIGLPRCFSSIGLYGNGAISLPFSSLVEKYKCAKTRLEMTLKEFHDPCVRDAAPTFATGRKWNPVTTVAAAKASLRHRDIVGKVQYGREGLRLGIITPKWQKATAKEQRHLVVEEVRRQEEATRCAKAVFQAQQGCWMRWEGIEQCKITWRELWSMETNRLSFIVRATYDVLPSPTNLQVWCGQDPACHMCAAPANLRHILVGCKTSLTQGSHKSAPRPGSLVQLQIVIIVELTVPWEEAINEVFERKKLRYANLAAEEEEQGWTVKVFPVEVGCRGLVASSTIRLLKELGIRGQAFESSCYEFVALQHSFLSAQAWCERGGGHLAFIQNDETQQFLQKHLQPEQDWWIGLVSTSINLTLDTQGGLIWLDGSDVIYSNWLSESMLDTGCGYINTDSGFHWKTASNCSQEFYFICEFELGRSLSCMDSTILHCGLDQVIEVDESYYGRKTPHYCRSNISSSLTASLEQCSWISVLDVVAELCNGQQFCTAVADGSSFGEPCPALGSYLLVEYHCKDKPSSVIVERSADDGDDSFVEKDSLTLRQDTHKRAKREEPGEKWICYPDTNNPGSFTIDCPTCGSNNNREKIQLSINANCQNTHWYVEDGSKVNKNRKGNFKKDCLNKKALRLQDGQNKNDLEIKANRIRSFKKDIIVVVFCKQSGTTYDVEKTIEYSWIKMDKNQLKNSIDNELSLLGGADDTEEFREGLLSDICATLEEPLQQPTEVLAFASVLTKITEDKDKVNVNAQENAGCVLDILSKSLNSINLDNITARTEIANLLVASSSHILAAFDKDKESDISGYLLTAVDSVQTFLLTNKTPDLEPTIITSPNVNIYVNRISPTNLQKEPFSIEDSAAGFKLPHLGSDILPVDEPVDVKMTLFNIDPWIEGQTIHSIVAGLSLSKTNGSGIPVANLTEEIEILLPRLDTAVNSSVLDLRNFSTLIINITTPNITLVMKFHPSEDLTLILLLGYENQPTEENNVATVTLPQQGNSQDERYTWLLGPSDMAVDVGVYNLLIRPVVPPGVKSINASLTITSITAQCIFWEEARSNWSDYGCRVGPKTTPNVTQCLCTHLTFFGSSFFVMPNTVDPSKSAELFSNFAQNPVVVCFIGAIFLAYTLVAAWARRKDLQDKTKVKITMLEDNDPFAEYCYLLKISTGHRMGSSTSSRVIVTLQGTEGECEPHHLTDPDKPVFERGAVDLFLLTTPFSLGELQSIRLWHDNSGDHPAWYVNMVMVEDLQTEQKWHFLCSSWLAVDIDDCTVEKVFPVASEADMKGFSNLFFMKTTTDFCDGHIWYSVVSRPPSSNFTRVQRVSCCFSVLLCSMLTSIMFYGIPTDPSEQTMDMGQIKLTWSEVMIGIQSSFIVFPVNLVIVGIFRHSRPRKKKTKKEKEHKQSEPPQMERDIPYDPASPLFDQNNLTVDFLIKGMSFRFFIKGPFTPNGLNGVRLSKRDCARSYYQPPPPNGLNGVRLSKRDCARSYYQPPPPSDIEKLKRNMVKQQKARALIMEILVFLGFLWMLLLVAYGQRDENGFYLAHHIRQSFSNGISESMNHNDVFTWANTVLLNNLFGQYPGFITDGNSKLVGGARLRQVRVKRDSCKIAKSMSHAVPECSAPYSWENEDMGAYGPGWDELNFINGSENTITAWQYQSQSALKAVPVWGMTALYRGGGYVMDLDSDLQNASRKLRYLFDSTWLDMYTRAVFAEFTVYNANVNLFCIVTLILESTAVGAFEFRSVVQSVRLYQSTGGFQSFLMASQVFYFLFIVYYMFLQAKLLKRQKWAYFKNKWNLLDLAIIILSWSSLSVFIKRTVQGDKDIEYYQNHKDQFPSFHDTAVIDATLGYLMAFLVLLACVKLWHLLRLNPKLHLITSSLQRAWNDMSSFIVVIFIILLAYSLTCNLIFGWKLYSYRTFPDAFKTIFSLQFGIFNYDEVLSSDPVLGALIISTCVIFITFVILTLFVSIILEAFGEEQENHQPSEEEEIVDLMLVKILSLFGIKCKKKEEETLPHPTR
ncbi:polycystic kidney disease protein 1-like 2 [Sinocyclocheilus grahami]|uniref:polycystic kidney disease protein 1-like 2 n=1 Tax=Sinocyclocheilus grahami TaxID=75366 RepID=UPI0007AD6890|nr:PREDICTED: polycystic kidney disease protein 1-like 2 [Sinocyclocheilus grahami]